jgi:anti-sigma regulatory factor (Ser/Thr protein kinase)
VISGGWRGPRWQIVDADPAQARQVRDWIRAAVTQQGCPVDPDDAALVTSELYTNAVRHGPAEGRVLTGCWLWPAGARIIVCDGGGTGTPQLRQHEAAAEGGRGLQVVGALAGRFGSFRLPGTQVVWCDLGQALPVPADDAWAWLHRVLAVRSLVATGGMAMDATTRKMRLAVEVLLAEPDEISDGLEAELYALRDKLDVMALEQATP